MCAHAHTCACVCTCCCTPLSTPLFRTCKGSSHLQHWSKAILKVIYKKTSSSQELLSLEGFSSSFPLRQPGVTLFPCTKGKVASPNADVNPVTIWTGWWEELGSRSPSPFPASTPNPQVQVQSLRAALVPVTILCRTKIFKPRSFPRAAHSTAYQATGPADNQAFTQSHVLCHLNF